jgi:hypothetical protein
MLMIPEVLFIVPPNIERDIRAFVDPSATGYFSCLFFELYAITQMTVTHILIQPYSNSG